MTRKLLFLMLLMLVLSGVLNLKAQSIVIEDYEGTKNSNLIEAVQAVTFSDDNLFINLFDGSSNPFVLSVVKKIYFQDVPIIEPKEISATKEINNVDNFGSLFLYPNPVDDVLFISNLPNHLVTISIFRIDGTQVINKEVSSEDFSLDLSKLKSGLYLLKANNKAYKFIKQ